MLPLAREEWGDDLREESRQRERIDRPRLSSSGSSLRKY
jgi:hypothetical protein